MENTLFQDFARKIPPPPSAADQGPPSQAITGIWLRALRWFMYLCKRELFLSYKFVYKCFIGKRTSSLHSNSQQA